MWDRKKRTRISRTFSTCFCTYLTVLLWVHFHEKKCNRCNFWQKRGAFSSPFCVLATTTCFLISFQWKKFRVPAKDASYFSRKFQNTFLLNCKFVLSPFLSKVTKKYNVGNTENKIIETPRWGKIFLMYCVLWLRYEFLNKLMHKTTETKKISNIRQYILVMAVSTSPRHGTDCCDINL